MVIFTDRFIPARFAGYTIGPIILIRPAYRDDVGLLVHEQTHVKQFWSNPFMMVLMHFRKYRLKYEVEAYKAQIAAGASLMKCVWLLANKYNLGITISKAKELLSP